MRWFHRSLPATFVLPASMANAAHLRMSGTSLDFNARPQNLASMSGSSNLSNVVNMRYTVNATLGGESVTLMVDTGSSDFIVTKQIPSASVVNEQYNVTIEYGIGKAAGGVYSATLDLLDTSISNQYYMYDPSSQAAGGTDGLLGLGPGEGSMILSQANNNATASPPIDRIFAINNNTDNYVGIHLGRSNDTNNAYPGDLTVGSPLADFSNVLNQPKLEVTQVQQSIRSYQHWQTYLDQDGIKGPDGTRIPMKSRVTGSEHPNKANVMLDTGYTFPQVPAHVAKALYQDIPGAQLQNTTIASGLLWTLPCDQKVSASFYFAGVEFPIHPLDLNFKPVTTDVVPGTNVENAICYGAFQPYEGNLMVDGVIAYDMILGMAFLRNVYMSINYGPPSNLNGAPTQSFIQLLPITNATQACGEFYQERQPDADIDSLCSDPTPSKLKIPAWEIGVIVAASMVFLLTISLCFVCFRRSKQFKQLNLPNKRHRGKGMFPQFR
ncbi:acid protease [Coniophora puteana RWD-64-598 SS2]|uniref:Acid protease n=1 Tax=Coniophora puteana (strain RWD-64-598) TaxID=741705 RepID=A0A5M3MPT4_CONPW|nr:acid protease [Coniophora puteana RWD-64-598 SS2]EIW81199.1 acid protease [Coniophora puteana RWD-64-598 SS2]